MKKILVPVDGSEFSMRAIEEAKKIAQAFGSEIVLLAVSGGGLTGQYIVGVGSYKRAEVFKADAEKILIKAKRNLGDLVAKTETVIKYGDPANEILNYLDGSDVDFVVMGSQGVGGSAARRFLMGSVAYKVLHNAKQLMLIVK